MYRVELKANSRFFAKLKDATFLMYRVELKEASCLGPMCPLTVPNVPCGVERILLLLLLLLLLFVPNVPCGVERNWS